MAGDSFGEKSVITAAPRNATVITREFTRMFVLEKRHYDVIARLGNVISNPSHCIASLSKTPSNRSQDDIQHIFGLFSQMTFFRQLPATSVHKLAQAAGYGVVDGDTPIVVQGDVRCNSFYVILSGSVSVHVLPNITKPDAKTLKDSNITLPMTIHRAHEEASAILAREIAQKGPMGDETFSLDELYIRHEHRVHLPFDKLQSDILTTVDRGFGKCVTTLGTSDTFGELSIHSDKDELSTAEQVNHVTKKITNHTISAVEFDHHQHHHHHHSSNQSSSPHPKTPKTTKTPTPPSSKPGSPSKKFDHLKTRIKMLGMVMKGQHHRTATVISRERTEFLIIDNTTFAELLAHRTINFEPELARRVLDKTSNNRTQDDIRILRELFHTIEFFKELPPSMVSALCEVIELREFYRNQHVYKIGDQADGMYVVLTGKISIHRSTTGVAEEEHAFSSGTHKENKHWSLLHHTMQTVHAIKSNCEEASIERKEKINGRINGRTKGKKNNATVINKKNTNTMLAAASAKSNTAIMNKRKKKQTIIRRASVSMGLKALIEPEQKTSSAAGFSAAASSLQRPSSPSKKHSIIDVDPSFVAVASMGDVIGERSLLNHSRRLNNLKVISERTGEYLSDAVSKCR